MISGKSIRIIGFSAGFTLLFAKLIFAAQAAGASSINSGDTAWILISTALVMLMIPGLALFWRNGAEQKCSGDHFAEYGDSGIGELNLGALWHKFMNNMG